MRFLSPESNEISGKDASPIPSALDSDPKADEEVINQASGEHYPKPIAELNEPAKIAPDDLAASIAYALDGSGPGPTSDKPNVSGHASAIEGSSGTPLDEESRQAD